MTPGHDEFRKVGRRVLIGLAVFAVVLTAGLFVLEVYL